MNIQIDIDISGVVKAVKGLQHSLLDAETMGRILQYASSVIWIPNVFERLDKSTAKSGYEKELDKTLYELDKEFVLKHPNRRYFTMTEAERRTRNGGYQKGEITANIKSVIDVSEPIAGEGYIAVGIGDRDLLNQVAGAIGNTDIPIWEVLQWGTGIYNPKSGSPVIRVGLQVFFHRKVGKAVAVKRTKNPGFEGRQYFVQLDGNIHQADYSVVDYVTRYMRRMLKRYSYKK